ncbi:MAG: YggS family pyridoxal phosphate-dependent enzyme [Kastovskya adunca ATA6-11-RM4]|jgi:pyridoxal phosphate enzyme (YggS family)|nr:YggS family pyridoxal phosphate-dependent enzyme [Kastovskya adunca ATA6-11-RM4]
MTGLIAKRITEIRQELPPHVRLIAVTKQVSVDAIRQAYVAGVRDFAESRIQEADQKIAQLQDLPDITWHLIGHLQSNKVKRALELFTWIHSVDSLKLAQRLDRLAAELSRQPQVCLQVKLAPDPDKYGWIVPELLADLPQLEACKSLKIQGLMTIVPLGLSRSNTLAVFENTRNLADKINQQAETNLCLQELSMGMSNDYPLAVEAGATMIRLGRTIFGERTP